MNLLAVDPGSNKCGLAFFKNGKLVHTKTLTTVASTPLSRRLHIADQLAVYMKEIPVVSEEPLLLGRNNNFMQRLLGMLEFLNPNVAWIHPMTMKKFCGSGKLDKMEVALAAGEKLTTDEEKEILADIIKREAFDESDAVAIGLCHLSKVVQ